MLLFCRRSNERSGCKASSVTMHNNKAGTLLWRETDKKEITTMKTIKISLMLVMLVSSSAFAQTDDLYFVPKKEKKVVRDVTRIQENEWNDAPAYYAGSNRSVDDYNRRGRLRSTYSNIEATDSAAMDIIDFEAGSGVYPDSIGLDSTVTATPRRHARAMSDYSDDDYQCCRRMQMFDGWYAPWAYYGDPFYGPYWSRGWGGWYDPWMYGYAGWYGPWRYGYYGWGWPYYSSYYWGVWGYPGYWTRPIVAVRRGHTGTLQYYDRSNYVSGIRRPGKGSRGNSYRNNSADYRNYNTNVNFGGRRNQAHGFDNSNGFGSTRYSQPSGSSFGGGARYGGSMGGSMGGSFGGSRGGAGMGGGGMRMGRR